MSNEKHALAQPGQLRGSGNLYKDERARYRDDERDPREARWRREDDFHQPSSRRQDRNYEEVDPRSGVREEHRMHDYPARPDHDRYQPRGPRDHDQYERVEYPVPREGPQRDSRAGDRDVYVDRRHRNEYDVSSNGNGSARYGDFAAPPRRGDLAEERPPPQRGGGTPRGRSRDPASHLQAAYAPPRHREDDNRRRPPPPPPPHSARRDADERPPRELADSSHRQRPTRARSPPSSSAKRPALSASSGSLIVGKHMSERELHQQISSSKSLPEICSLLLQYGDMSTLDKVNVTTSLKVIGTLFNETRQSRAPVSNDLRVVLTKLVDRVAKLAPELGTRDISTILFGITRGKFSRTNLAHLCKQVFDLLLPQLLMRPEVWTSEDLRPLHVSVICGSMLKAKRVPDENLLNVLASVCSEGFLKDFEPHEVGAVAALFASVKKADLALFQRLAQAFIAKGASGIRLCQPEKLMQVVTAFAEVKIYHEELFRLVVDDITTRDLDAFWPSSLCKLLWSFASVGIANTNNLYVNLAREATVRSAKREVESPALAQGAWALAAMSLQVPEYFDLAAKVLTKSELSFLKHDELANLCWAFAKLSILNAEMFERMAEAIVAHKLETFPPASMANIAWAYGSALLANDLLFSKANMMSLNLASFAIHDLLSVGWALSVLGYHHAEWFQSLATHIETTGVASLQLDDVVTALWLFAMVRLVPSSPGVLAGLVTSALEQFDKLQPSQWATVSRACAQLRVGEAFIAKVASALQTSQDLSTSDLAHLVWALACSKKLQDVQQFLSSEANLNDEDEQAGLELAQSIKCWSTTLPLPRVLQSAQSLPWVASAIEASHRRLWAEPGALHGQIAEALKDMGYTCETELVLEGGVAVDVRAVDGNGRAWLLALVRRPEDLLSNGQESGQAIMRQRVALPHDCKHVDASQWAACASREDRQALLTPLLQ